jgi:phage baseplate assembly protein W
VSEEFIGSGWAFPLRTDSTGAIAVASRDRKIEESIRLILGTAYGERPMRPEFGCAIHEFVFSYPDANTIGRIGAEVRASLVRWEPRIDVLDVVVTVDELEPSTVYIDVTYSLRHTNDPRNLVFPFYMIPSESDTQKSPSALPEGEE